jgi:DNA invertase Pin-like site-specific DNA recombinase
METDRDQPQQDRPRRWLLPGLAAVVAADGVLAFALGGPAWLAVLYAALGVTLALAWAGLVRRRPVAPPAPAPPVAKPPLALGYVCVRGRPDAGDLTAQTEAIRGSCQARGLVPATIVHDAEAASDGGRPSLRWALEQIAAGQAQVLVVARLRDLSSTVADLSPLMRWFTEPGRTLIAVDLRIDTSTEAGRLAALAVAGVGTWERERAAARAPNGLEARRLRAGGQRRTAVADVPELQDRINRMRQEGMTLQAIADRLNEEGVPTLRGGAMWRPSSVQRATGYRRPSSQARGIELPKDGTNGRPARG